MNIACGDVVVEIVPHLDERVVPMEVAPQLGAVVRDPPLADFALSERPPDHVAIALRDKTGSHSPLAIFQL